MRGKRFEVPDPTTYANIIEGLKTLYKRKIRPLEEMYKYDMFHSALLTDTDIEAKPFILLMGQYSTGKTTFIKYLLEQEYPGCHIGPEPTTDRFVAVMNGASEKVIPGNAACVANDLPFTGLTRFGTSFMSKFQVSQTPASFLEHVTIIDTPGVLSGEKQRIGRAYNFVEVCEWFAERADLILLLFDAHKLDISDEFKSVIQTLKPHTDKIRVVLNKADTITNQQLMRVF
jgi:GTPase SAR1 family protein